MGLSKLVTVTSEMKLGGINKFSELKLDLVSVKEIIGYHKPEQRYNSLCKFIFV